MERWHRAFLKNDVEFKELFGIKKEIFLEMLPILTAAYHERHRKGVAVELVDGLGLCQSIDKFSFSI